MQVHCDEGVANHIGPEPCVCQSRGWPRSVGRGLYRPAIEPRKLRSECRRRLTSGRQHDHVRQREHAIDSAWSETLACTDAPCTGTGISRDRPLARAPVRIGKALSQRR